MLIALYQLLIALVVDSLYELSRRRVASGNVSIAMSYRK